MSEPAAITRILKRWREGEPGALDELAPQVLEVLHSMAEARMRGEGAQTLQPTALVNEAFLRLMKSDVDWQDRAHFYAVAALQMRSVLVDRARERQADKRGGDIVRVTLSAAEETGSEADVGLIELDNALRALEAVDAIAARVIELAYFGGLGREEVAHVLDVSVSTAFRAERFGKAWLKRALGG
jgi:RNA polymerase sigma factor (TIGR02999 family)